jgi:hypothetical protein
MTSQNVPVWNMSLFILTVFKGLSHDLKARIWIRIRTQGEKSDPDPHQGDQSDPRPQHCIEIPYDLTLFSIRVVIVKWIRILSVKGQSQIGIVFWKSVRWCFYFYFLNGLLL